MKRAIGCLACLLFFFTPMIGNAGNFYSVDSIPVEISVDPLHPALALSAAVGIDLSAIAIVAILCGTIVLLAIVFAFREVFARFGRSKALSEDESQMLEELWKGLSRMEERIANLETILLQRARR